MARQETANALINRAALEMGIAQVADPVGSDEQAFIQLVGLLNAVGQELVELHPWQTLRQVVDFTTATASSDTQLGDGVTVGLSGVYDLPDDFSYMIDQTHWDRTNSLPVGGPLSAQAWTYLEGRDLAGTTIYADFRLAENKMELFPQPAADGLRVTFEYISRNWVRSAASSTPNQDVVNVGSDIVLYEPVLVVKFLKVKFLEAKGLPSQAARIELDTIFHGRTGKDEGAPILNAAGTTSSFPYINPYRNVGDTGFGI